MSVESAVLDNLVPLPSAAEAAELERALIVAGQVRQQLHLLQGYADLMDGLSPQQNLRVLKVMAEKIEDLTHSLRPFLHDAMSYAKPTLEEYRQARSRNQELMAEYRALLKRLRSSIEVAHSSLSAR